MIARHSGRMAVGMGLMIGLMLPWMVHGGQTGGWAALAFVLGHVAIVLIALVAGLLVMRLRPGTCLPSIIARLRTHRPSHAHLVPGGAGLALGWAMTCVICLSLYAGGLA